MSDQRDKRMAICPLLATGMNVSEVAPQTGASRVTVTHVRDEMERKEHMREKSVRTEELVAQVEERVSANPNTSMQALAWETAASRTSMQCLVREDLGMRAYAKQEHPLLSEDTRSKREEHATTLINRLKRVDTSAPTCSPMRSSSPWHNTTIGTIATWY